MKLWFLSRDTENLLRWWLLYRREAVDLPSSVNRVWNWIRWWFLSRDTVNLLRWWLLYRRGSVDLLSAQRIKLLDLIGGCCIAIDLPSISKTFTELVICYLLRVRLCWRYRDRRFINGFGRYSELVGPYINVKNGEQSLQLKSFRTIVSNF